ncbi:response regulator [Ginsengibacter hankyongi]|uniref:Response regulator n=1 Tax=Ginsengibacter hankyongi TaxID=2607284 RepID=A0A5J5IM75_9BACT|nr:adenylate/guanylate cyclase domain-containing response regulator [Ginsengibacter hankyongi]KAA9041841.1 response regulator [Ginsengibacter hankyongi]
MAKILVADDEADLEVLIKQKFRKEIRENTYEFIFAANGNEALKKLQQDPGIDVLLSDINMPEMDGLTLLSKLNELHLLTKAVIVSAYGDMENIRTAMNRGAFDFVCKPVNFHDLGITIQKTLEYVSQLHSTLDAIKENNILKMYVDKTVLNFMNGREFETQLMANETIEATVAFVDISGFTAITEKEPADTVVQMLNKYFDIMVKEIIAQDGYVDKFIGDAILAIFKGRFHLDRAIDASLAIRKHIEELGPESAISSYIPKVSVGIDSGEMISGNIGSAKLRRLDYTVIGDVVNTAQRLQDAAKPGQILISEDSWAKVKESFNCKAIDHVKMKNKSKSFMAYEVLD